MEPSASAQHSTRRYTALGTGVLAAGALTYIGLGDPHRPGSCSPVPVQVAHRLECPACGGLR